MFKKLIFILGSALPVLFFSCTQQTDQSSGNKTRVFTQELTQAEKDGGRLTPEILWKFGRVDDAQLSPDGAQVVYNVTFYNINKDKGNADIWRIGTASGKASRLTDFDGADFNARWTPDGKRIGYISSRSGTPQVWEMDPDGNNKRQISHIEGGINHFEYSPDSKNIYYTQDVKLDQTPHEKYPDLPKADVIIASDLMYRHWDQWEDGSYSHIFITSYTDDIRSGKDIMPGERWDAPLAPYYDHSEIAWSPDGKRLAYTCKKLTGKDYAVSTNSDIYLYDLKSGETKNITEGMPGYDKYPAFSPDGEQLAWMSMATPGYESDKQRLFVYDFKTDKKEYLTADFDQNVANMQWDDSGKKIYFISGINATYQIYSIDLPSKSIKKITSGKHDYTGFCRQGDVMIGTRMSMSMATEIFKIDAVSGNETQLTYTNQPIYDNIKMGEVKGRWVKTTDNKKELVWVIYPPDFDSTKTYPALLYCQGGPQSAVSQFFSFRWNFQIMAANDYIIVAPNRRGLPTFGAEWNAEISGDYGGQNMKDYLSAIDEVKKEPYVDENRLGCVGASYGGYSVYWLAGHHNKRFKCFISHCGMYNFESFYAATEETFFPNHDFGGPYWQQPKPKSYDFSPHLFVQNWDTPIMIITGGRDFRIPYTESLQAFNAARLRGIPAKLLYFPDESHFVSKPQDAILWQREFFNWLDKYLK